MSESSSGEWWYYKNDTVGHFESDIHRGQLVRNIFFRGVGTEPIQYQGLDYGLTESGGCVLVYLDGCLRKEFFLTFLYMVCYW